MFDFSAYVGPAVVLAGILLALVGFAVWGSREIRESAEEMMAAATPKVDSKPVAKLAPEVGDDQPKVDLLLENPALNLEHTAEFVQAGFAQSFKPEEVPEVDFDAAIDRITADLAAAEAAGEKQTADVAEELPAVDEDIEATRMLAADDRAAILQETEEQESAEEENDEEMEQTIVMPKLTDEQATETLPADDVLDKIALEETRVINQELEQEIEQELAEDGQPVGAAFGEGAEEESHQDSLFPESPVPFGPKMAWLAIPGYKPSEVISALRLGDVAPANWTKGLSQAYADNNQVFVTPALSGWVLVIGKTLWQKADMNRSAENIQWLKDVGRLFGNACFFSTMRGLGNHGWVGIRGGNIVRAYGYSGELQELIWLLGDPTEEEIAVNPGFANEVQEREQPDFRPVIPDEKMVLAMAAGWSVDVSFRNRRYMPDYGFVGTLE